MTLPVQPSSPSIVVTGALYPTAQRGLTAATLAAAGLDLRVHPVCTTFVMSTAHVVTDFVEVPEDTIAAQLEHVSATANPVGMLIGVLGSHGAVGPVMDFADRLETPVILDLRLSGPAGETLLSSRGLENVRQYLHIPDLVLLTRTDAELVSGGEIRSLDDANVAVQRIIRQGAQAVCIKCGSLPARHFDTAPDENDGPLFAVDMLYDGTAFTLFEAPLLPPARDGGANAVHSIALLKGLTERHSLEESMQFAKQHVTESLRGDVRVGREPGVDYFWSARRSTP